MKKNYGFTISTSHNALMVQFVGGPYDGEEGLYDSFGPGITLVDWQNNLGHNYEPANRPNYRFTGSYDLRSGARV